jgi:hypothetical protein
LTASISLDFFDPGKIAIKMVRTVSSLSFRQIAMDASLLDSMTLCQPAEVFVIDRVPERTTSPAQSMYRFNCKFCPDAGFHEAEEFREHHRSDWHNHNLSANLKKKPLLTEGDYAEFQKALAACQSDSDEYEESGGESVDADAEDTEEVKIDSKIKFQLKEQVYSLHRTLLFDSKQDYKSGTVTLQLVKDFISRTSTSKWAFFLIRSGRVYAAIFDLSLPCAELILHKSFKRYTERRKQGGSQMLRDKSGKVAKSAGSQLRRANEVELLKDVERLMESWRKELEECQLIFWNRNFFSQIAMFQAEKIIAKSDLRLRTLPFSISKPCIEEAIRSFKFLSHAIRER